MSVLYLIEIDCPFSIISTQLTAFTLTWISNLLVFLFRRDKKKEQFQFQTFTIHFLGVSNAVLNTLIGTRFICDFQLYYSINIFDYSLCRVRNCNCVLLVYSIRVAWSIRNWKLVVNVTNENCCLYNTYRFYLDILIHAERNGFCYLRNNVLQCCIF